MQPITRKEFFMAKAAGDSVPEMSPITREEYFLNRIAENGGGGGGVIYVSRDLESGEINATFNELLQHFNNGEFVLTNNLWDDDDDQVIYVWNILTEMVQASNAYYVYFTEFRFYNGGAHPYTEIFYAADPDEKMVIYD